MSRYVLAFAAAVLVVGLATGLAGCAVEKRSALIAEEASGATADRCAEIATTGDFYRYCLEVGPERAMRH